MVVRYLAAVAKDRRGMALLITIMVVSLLIGVTVQLSRTVHQGYFAAAAQLDGQKFASMSRSGLAIGVELLEMDRQNGSVDTLQDAWATLTDDQLAGLFTDGEVKVAITDLAGRLQLNSLVADEAGGLENEGGEELGSPVTREILLRLLVEGEFGVEGEEEARSIVDAITDWLDPDDEESEFGAESGYYHSLATPYECRNGAVRDIEELLLVKGVTPQLLYGDGGRPGLAEYLTVHGRDGVLNLNTMPTLLLQALHPLMTEELAEMLDEFRNSEEYLELLADSGWYRIVPGFPGDIELPSQALGVKGTYFLVTSEAAIGERSSTMRAVVSRGQEQRAHVIELRME